jgi:hypothetical protein
LALAVLAGTTPPDPDSDDGYNDPANAPSKQQAGLQVAPLANPNLGTYHGSTKDGQTIWKDGSGNLYIELAASGQRVPVSANGTPLPQSQWKASYTIGQSDGGPGVWINAPPLKNPADSCYQCQITGAPVQVEYKVNGIRFDGYDPSTNVLIDAKRFENWPLPDKAFSVNSILLAADTQTRAARGTSATIVWHVPNQAAKAKIEQIFKSRTDAPPPPIIIKITPKG